MKILEGDASEILHDWVKGRYDVFYKYNGTSAYAIEIYDQEADLSFLPNEETKYYLDIILSN